MINLLTQQSGCKECNNTGYYDRIGVFEILLLNDEVKEAIVNTKSSFEVKKIALEHGYKPLIVDGIRKVIEGVTTLEELDKKLVIY